MSVILWLASYPRSGNTWLRAFLTNLRLNHNLPAGINELDAAIIASSREVFDASIGYESGELGAEEIERLRPEVYTHIAGESKDTLYIKIHDAWTFTRNGVPLVPREATLGAIYVVRNPLDVCVSLADFEAVDDYDETIDFMKNPASVLCGLQDRQHTQLRQRLLSWSGHVQSWAKAQEIRVHLMRYEDMKSDSRETFTRAAIFAQLPSHPLRIARALQHSAFENLKRQEEEDGFLEKLSRKTAFFRTGEVGSWRGVLSAKQVSRLIRDHGDVMRRFGYLTDDGELLCCA